jgi:hypothetical protein
MAAAAAAPLCASPPVLFGLLYACDEVLLQLGLLADGAHVLRPQLPAKAVGVRAEAAKRVGAVPWLALPTQFPAMLAGGE